jgi:IS5 family transposase
MAVRNSGQFSFVDALLSRELGHSDVLERLVGLVKWYRLEKVMNGLRQEAGPGRPGYRPLELFKGLLLQSLYGLSDAELEYALRDRLSFRRFVGLSLEDSVPDHSTYCRFRNLLVSEGRLEKLFAELDRQLELAGVVIKRGTMLDATVIEAAARPPGEERASADPDARFVKRQGKGGSTFGYKAHVGVDQGSGLIRAVCTTPANVNDTTPADHLIRGDERQVLADAAYHTHAREQALRSRGIKPRLMRRANKHHPVLPPRVRRLNRLIARQRAAVETTFATLKRRMGLRVRYRGQLKVAGQVLLAAIAFNMRRWAALSP